MTSFDLDTFLALPGVSGLALSPDGSRLVTSVATAAPDGTKFQSALWQLDPAGEAAPRRLTRSAQGETGATFLPDGSVVGSFGGSMANWVAGHTDRFRCLVTHASLWS